jgi:hypothetical protein
VFKDDRGNTAMSKAPTEVCLVGLEGKMEDNAE